VSAQGTRVTVRSGPTGDSHVRHTLPSRWRPECPSLCYVFDEGHGHANF
jgi:hypothetical protein